MTHHAPRTLASSSFWRVTWAMSLSRSLYRASMDSTSPFHSDLFEKNAESVEPKDCVPSSAVSHNMCGERGRDMIDIVENSYVHFVENDIGNVGDIQTHINVMQCNTVQYNGRAIETLGDEIVESSTDVLE